MIPDIKIMRKEGDLLNSEGGILVWYSLKNRNFLASFLKDGKGYVYYETSIHTLKQFLQAEISLQDLYDSGLGEFVASKQKNQTLSHLKEDFRNDIEQGSQKYDSFSSGMKNAELERSILNKI